MIPWTNSCKALGTMPDTNCKFLVNGSSDPQISQYYVMR